jgi:hypothetical protein
MSQQLLFIVARVMYSESVVAAKFSVVKLMFRMTIWTIHTGPISLITLFSARPEFMPELASSRFTLNPVEGLQSPRITWSTRLAIAFQMITDATDYGIQF